MVDTETETVLEIGNKLTATIVASDDVVDIAWIDGFVPDTEGAFVDVIRSSSIFMQDSSEVVDIAIGFSHTVTCMTCINTFKFST